MFNKKITRSDFLKTGFLGILAFLALPIFKMFTNKDSAPQKDARYYKNLAG